jgi:hypothetical protein
LDSSSSQTIEKVTVQFQVTLPYSREAFTEVVQEQFRSGIAAAASEGCKCKITKAEVTTSIEEAAAAPGTRRRLHAAASIAVDVSILVPDAKTGRLLVESGALSVEKINYELQQRGVEPITAVTSKPLLSSPSTVQNDQGTVLGGIIGGAVAGAFILVVISCMMMFRSSSRIVDAAEYDEFKGKLPLNMTNSRVPLNMTKFKGRSVKKNEIQGPIREEERNCR